MASSKFSLAPVQPTPPVCIPPPLDSILTPPPLPDRPLRILVDVYVDGTPDPFFVLGTARGIPGPGPNEWLGDTGGAIFQVEAEFSFNPATLLLWYEFLITQNGIPVHTSVFPNQLPRNMNPFQSELMQDDTLPVGRFARYQVYG